MQTLIQSFIFTLSTFTRIPISFKEYKPDTFKYVFIFFPIIGIIISSLMYLILSQITLPIYLVSIIFIVLNIIITGGIHLDGYLDTCDAIYSYQSKENKLRIIKDPTIGAFGLIHLITIILVQFVFLNIALINNQLFLVCMVFIYSRSFSNLFISYSSIQENDMLELTYHLPYQKYYLVLSLIIITMTSFIINDYLIVSICVLFTIYIKHILKKHFDNLCGDHCGYYIVCLETILLGYIAFFINL